MLRIKELTPEQELQIATYTQKWRNIALSTQPIEHSRATAAVEAFYTALGKQKPQIRFFQGPEALRQLFDQYSLSNLRQQFGLPLTFMLVISERIVTKLEEQIELSVWHHLQQELMSDVIQQVLAYRQLPLLSLLSRLNTLEPENEEMLARLPEELLSAFWENQQQQWRDNMRSFPGGEILLGLGDFFSQQLQPVGEQLDNIFWKPLVQPMLEEWTQELKPLRVGVGTILGALGVSAQFFQDAPIPLIDFCTEVLGCQHDSQLWSALQSVMHECGAILPCEKVCLVIERPTKLLVDEQNRLHGEGTPAIIYPDDSCQYFFHGVQLPATYAAVHPNQWKASWLLTEQNAELRRALIQGIGYARICQELAAVELDSWREYTLLRIDQNIDVEPIYLLKMTCPSTSFIHATRVPPTIQSAREAIRWVNWGVDPQEFAVES